MEDTNTFDVQADTMRGDVRDVLLTHVRSMETPWSKLSERDQRTRIDAIEKCASTLVRNAVRAVANQGFPHIVVSTGKWTVKEGIKLEVIGTDSVENITSLAQHGNGSAILVLCEVGEFFGERREVKADPDQASLDMDGDDEEDGDPVEEPAAAAEEPAVAPDAPAEPEAPRRGRRGAQTATEHAAV